MRIIGIGLIMALVLGACLNTGGNGVNAASHNSDSPLADSLVRLKLLFVGDVMGHSPQISAAYDPATKTHNYEPCFKYIEDVVSNADLAFANLEVTLSSEPPYTGYPMFRSPDALADALQKTGFDVIATANNHSNDGGLKGVNHTIDKLKQLELLQTGTFKDAADRRSRYPLVFKKDINGRSFKLAVLNCTYGTNGIPDHSPSIVNKIDTAEIRADYRRARAYSPDVVIAFMHWGLEYQLSENPEQQKLSQFLAELGIDLIVGAHPHVVQPIKIIQGAGRSVLCAYSLGNFISNQQQANTDVGLMFEVELVKNVRSGEIYWENYHYIPVWRYIANATSKDAAKRYYVLPVSAVEADPDNLVGLSKSDKDKMTTHTNTIRKNLDKHGISERPVGVGALK